MAFIEAFMVFVMIPTALVASAFVAFVLFKEFALVVAESIQVRTAGRVPALQAPAASVLDFGSRKRVAPAASSQASEWRKAA
jgi:hypothetical protein